MDKNAAHNRAVSFIDRRLQEYQDRAGKLIGEIEAVKDDYIAALVEEVVLAPGGVPGESQARAEDFRKKLEGLVQARKTLATNFNNLKSLKNNLENGMLAQQIENLAANLEDMERLVA